MIDITDEAPAAQLRRLARALRHLAPSRTDPERYHLEKSEIVSALPGIARGLPWWTDARQQPQPAAPEPVQNGELFPRPTVTPNGIGALPSPQTHCKHCRWRQAKQTYRHRLKLLGRDLFDWADRREGNDTLLVDRRPW